MDLEELKQAILIGDKTKKVVTTRFTLERIEQIKMCAIILQAQKKLKARVSIEETLDNGMELFYESLMKEFNKVEIAEPLQNESIAQETLQVASIEQISDQIPEKPPLQVENKKQYLIGGMTKEEIEKEARKAVPSIMPTLQANSKHLHLVKSEEKKPEFVKKLFNE